MDAMPTTSGAHARPVPKRDLLWVLVLIAACALLEVWGSWLVIGSETGFPRIGGMTTGWILPVSTEAYWACAGYAWLASPAGPRSRRFAMWSALGMIVLSLAGQESDHLLAFAHRTIPPVAVVMLVTALPLVALVLIAILIHLRHPTVPKRRRPRSGPARRLSRRSMQSPRRRNWLRCGPSSKPR